MNHFTNRQVIVLCVLSMGFGALFSPPLKSVAQPPESGPDGSGAPNGSKALEGSTVQDSATPQPLATAPAAAGRTTAAIGTITGQGTTGYISKFTGANSIGNSVIFESGGKISIGTTTPVGPFSVTGVGTNPSVIYGTNTGTGNTIVGRSLSGIGVYGLHDDTSSDLAGVAGETASTSANATGVSGTSKAAAPGTSSAGVRGINKATNSKGFGVYGSQNGSGTGVYGTAPSGSGVWGDSNSGIGVRGRHSLTTGTAPGVQGETNSTADNATGVKGVVNPTDPGVSSAGVSGINNGTSSSGIGVYGSHAGYGYGVYGTTPSGYGVYGVATNGTGVRGSSTSGSGIYGTSSSGYGVYGYSSSSTGLYGYSYSNNGVYGYSSTGTGIKGASAGHYGVYGSSSDSIGRGLCGVGYVGVEGSSSSASGYAGDFTGLVYIKGDLVVTGSVSKGGGSFKIDHPQHPETEYLSHSFVESPDMMNVYNGNITTNAKGEAVVTLPSYFQSLNRDFRYQLTPIGQFAQAIVGQKVKGNHFLIRTDKPNVEVSWQVTGIRNDAYARQHRIQVEESKTGADRGKYLFPAAFGFGKDKQIGPNMPRLAKR